MSQELPYLPTYKNVGLLFTKIGAAKVPESFTQKYLYHTIGLKAPGDRPLISLLKTLGFVDNSGKPTPRYAALKNDKIAGKEIARGVVEAYEPLFAADENAHKLEGSELRGLVAQVAGTDSGTTSKIVGTFKALVAISNFETDRSKDEASTEVAEEPTSSTQNERDGGHSGSGQAIQGMRPEFHYNIQVHLPSTGSEETYMHIFNAIRKVFK
jgi:hypothetical protein